MTQADMQNFLQKNPKKWFTLNEIVEQMGNKQGRGSAARNLRAMRKHKLVEWDLVKYGVYIYKHKSP